MTAAYTLTHSFMTQLAERIRQVSVVELFNGVDNRDFIVGKLALDFGIPLNWSATPSFQKFGLSLVCRISYKNSSDDKYYPAIIKANIHFTKDTILESGPGGWPTRIEALSYQLVRALKTQIMELNTPYKHINISHREALETKHKRIEIT